MTKLGDNLKHLIAHLDDNVEAGLEDVAQAVAEKARTETYYSHGASSPLRDATKAVSYGKLEKGVVADKFYATWVDQGRGPVYAKASEYLVFWSYRDNHWVKVKSVRSAPPFPFFTKAVAWARENIIQIIAKHIFTGIR